MENRLIAHSLIKAHGKYLVIRRNKIKRGQKNVYPAHWDIPGGRVEAVNYQKWPPLGNVVKKLDRD